MSEDTQNAQGRRASIGKAYDEDEKTNVAKDLAKAKSQLKRNVGTSQHKYYMDEVRYLTKKLASSK